MKMKLHILIVVVFTTITPLLLTGQQLGDNRLVKETSSPEIVKANTGFNPRVSVSLGSSFGSFGSGFNSFGTWIMPEISTPVTKKFSVSVGMGYSSMFTAYPGEASMFSNTPQQYGSVYVRGIYELSEKVTISATGYKTFNLQPSQKKETINPHALDLSSEGVMINLNYKVNDNFEINAGFSYDKRNCNPYYYNGGLMNGGFNNPAMGGFGGFRPGF
jgi:hypothetical protein